MAAFTVSKSFAATTPVTRQLRATRTFAVSNGNELKTTAKQMWLPGGVSPDYLDGSMPGDYGFDPLGIGKNPASLARCQEAELIHSRWCMLASVGMISVEALGYGDWISAPLQETQTYFGVEAPFALGPVIGIEVVAMAYLEAMRNNETDPVKRCYPGGAFDPLGLSKDAEKFEVMKVREIKNGRLAMVAVLGMWLQAYSTGTTPVANWAAHVADPWHVNVGANATALPF